MQPLQEWVGSDQEGVGPLAREGCNSRRVQLATLAARHAIPSASGGRDGTEAGLLVSYGTSVADMYRRVGGYTGCPRPARRGTPRRAPALGFSESTGGQARKILQSKMTFRCTAEFRSDLCRLRAAESLDPRNMGEGKRREWRGSTRGSELPCVRSQKSFRNFAEIRAR